MRSLLFLALITVIILLFPASQLTAALPWKIIANPDPPPNAAVGHSYSVTFTTNVGYKADWICVPEKPVPGLSFSKMSSVSTVTLSGKPSKAGTYKFTLKVYYKGELMAQRGFMIKVENVPLPRTFNIYHMQIKPAIALLGGLIPLDIYVGDAVLFVFWTDHPDPESITWSGIDALPGTSFTVMSRYKFIQSLQGLRPDVLQAVVSSLVHIDPKAPVLVMYGKAERAGVFRVYVEASDNTERKTDVFYLSVLEPSCTFSLSVNPSNIIWNTTAFLFPPPESLSDRYYYESEKTFTLRIEAICHGNVGDIRGNITIYTPSGFSFLDENDQPLNGTEFVLSGNRVSRIISLRGKINLLNPIHLTAPYPGETYTIRIRALAYDGFIGSAYDTLNVTVFYFMPQISVEEFQPVSQLSNPYHYLEWWNVYREEKNLLVIGKQTTFRFNVTLNFIYPVTLKFRIRMPKSDWEWTPTEVNNPPWQLGSYSYYFVPKHGATIKEEVEDWQVSYYEETQDSYILYYNVLLRPRVNYTKVILEEFEGLGGFWFPKPSRTPARAVLELYGIGDLDLDIMNSIDNDDLVLPYIRKSGSFNSPVTSLGELKLGYFIMDSDSFTQRQIDDIHNNFPDAIKRYLEAVFPIIVKEVRFIRYVGRPDMPGWSTESTWAWDADTWGEWTEEANLDRSVMIVPNDALDWASAIGMVMHCGVCWGDDSTKVAIVEYDYAADNEYLPVVAHELSHTFGFPDIYFGKFFPRDLCTTCQFYGLNVTGPNESDEDSCTGVPLVLGYFAYFDEVHGGLIAYNMSGYDVMACARSSSSHWVYHSWNAVKNGCINLDPPDGLLISLIIFENGTVIGRPFSRLYNHSHPFPSQNGVGNFKLQLVSRSGKILRSYPFNLTFEIEGGIKTSLRSLVKVVEWFDDLGQVRLIGPDGKVWFAREVSEHAPRVSILYPLDGMKLKRGRQYVIKWTGVDEDGDELWFNVHMRKVGELSWNILAHRMQANSITLKVPENMEEGKYELLVKATDGVNTGYRLLRVEVVDELPTYEVVAFSNIGVDVEGSGVYEEGSNVTLRAPSQVSMKGFLGLIGGKYIFERWSGDVNSTSSTVSFIAHFSKAKVSVKAIYREDLTAAYMFIAVVLALIVLLLAAFRALKRKKV